MKKTLVAAAVAIMLSSAPAFAQKVSVGHSDGSKDAFFLNAEYAKDVGNDIEGVIEGRLRTNNQHDLKVGLQREFVSDGFLTVSGRVNLTQSFGKDSATGWSVKPTGAFGVYGATVTLGYEFGDTFKSNARDRVRTTSVEVMYPASFGNVGLKLENELGDRRSDSLSLVYALKN